MESNYYSRQPDANLLANKNVLRQRTDILQLLFIYRLLRSSYK